MFHLTILPEEGPDLAQPDSCLGPPVQAWPFSAGRWLLYWSAAPAQLTGLPGRRFFFRSGNIEHPEDKLFNTSVEVLPFDVSAVGCGVH